MTRTATTRTSAPPPPSRRGLVLLLIVVVLSITSAAIAEVWTHLRAIEFGYQIARARTAQTKLRERNRRLHIELALLKSPERVGRVAREELGMRQPEPEQIHRLRRPRLPAKPDGKTPTSPRRPLAAGLWPGWSR
jgi:cell division protein FtsL